jgi:hypothetical protein
MSKEFGEEIKSVAEAFSKIKNEAGEDFSFIYVRGIRCAICNNILRSDDVYINLKSVEVPNIPVKVSGLPSPYIHKRCKQKYNADLIDSASVIEVDMTKKIEDL